MGGSGDSDIQRHGIAGYENLVPIGSGGSSSVYRATDVRHQRLVALKLLGEPATSPSGRTAFQREVEAIGKVGHHPYVVTVLGSGFTTSGHPYLALPLFENGTFSQLVDEHGPLTWAAAVDVGIKLCSAVETVHRAGVVHRDIKPGNVFVGVTPEHPLLGDFGIASTVDPRATQTTTVAVTFGYSAPEVLDDQRPTPASDIYSLAMTLYRLIQGLHAYYAQSPAAIVRKVLADADQPRFSAGVPVELAAVVAGALAKDPTDRPASALALGRELQAVQTAHGLTVTDLVVAGEPPRLSDDTLVTGSGRPRVLSSTDQIESTMLAAIRDRHRFDPVATAVEPSQTQLAARPDAGAILAAALDPDPGLDPEPPGQGEPRPAPAAPVTIDLPTVVRPRQPRDMGPAESDAVGRKPSRARLLGLSVMALLIVVALAAGAVVALG